LGNYEAAIENFEKAIELDPEVDSSYMGKALSYRGLEKPDEALQTYNRAIELIPDHAGLYNERGWLYFEDFEEYDSAINDFSMAIEIHPEGPYNHYFRGYAYQYLGRVDEARADFEMVMELTRGDPSFEHYSFVVEWLEANPHTVPGCVDPPPGLVSWWPGDGHAEDLIGGNHATLVNGAGFAGGIVEEAFAFPPPNMDGQDGFAEAIGTSNLDDLRELTIETWVMLNSGPAYRIERFITIAIPDSNVPKAVLRIEGGPGDIGHLHFYMGIDREFQHLLSDKVPRTGSFHHVAGTYDGNVMRLYLDGDEAGNLAVTGNVVRGTSFPFMSSEDEPLDGMLDEISIYDRALTAGEIQAIFEAGSAGKCKP
jgi:hypothetical protein